ncbi:MAG TPA: pilus assembly protein N-terminal domain-containing protein [Terracidiphilus sp.]|jgi:pilus assembly protein CpaC
MRSNRVQISRCLAVAFCVALTALPLTVSAQAAHSGVTRQDATNDLSLVVGRSVLLDTAEPIQRVATGVGDFAEAQVITPTEIMVNGKAIGETTLILWESGGNREFFNVRVTASAVAERDRLEGLRRELRTELAGQDIKITEENGAVFLRGTVSDLTGSARAVQIATAAGAKVVNLLNVQVPPAKPQILLKVIFASVDRTKTKQLGINLFSTGLGNTDAGATTGQYTPPIVAPGGAISLTNDLNLFAFFPGLNFGATIQALETKGLVQVLAEPNVLTEDGKQGSLLAGGEYPYPIIQGSSTGGSSVTIMFKEFGVRLNFLPTIMPNGNIRLQVAPEVSSLDFSSAVTVSGFLVPAIAIRRVKSEIELSQGQSFAIGGLLDNRTTETLMKIPYISNIPILGKFFQSVTRTKSNTELVVIVTPEIVQPSPAGSLSTPKYLQSWMPPNSSTPMHQPDQPPVSAQAVPPSIPVESLIESMKPEKELQESGSYSVGSGSSGGGSSPQ